MTEEEVIEFYNQRGAKEKIFDQMDNHHRSKVDKGGCLSLAFPLLRLSTISN